MTNKATIEATEVRETLDKLGEADMGDVEGMGDVIEMFTREVVENGTFLPGNEIKADLNLSLRERLTGHREQNIEAILSIGMVLGAALERDVPEGSEKETDWRKERFELPREDEIDD